MAKEYGINNAAGRPTITELSAYWDAFDGEPQKFDDAEDMAKRCWLYLTNDGMPDIATIKKEAFLHEVTAMIETAIAFANKDT